MATKISEGIDMVSRKQYDLYTFCEATTRQSRSLRGEDEEREREVEEDFCYERKERIHWKKACPAYWHN